MKQRTFQFKDLLRVFITLYELLCLRRWSDVIPFTSFNELAKQALNSMVSFIWSTEVSNSGINVDFSKFPRLTLSRCFWKIMQCDLRGENLDTILDLGNIDKVEFTESIWSQFSQNLSEEFYGYLRVDEQDCLESRIYRASSTFATLVELKQIKPFIHEKDYVEKYNQIVENLQTFSDLPGFEQITSSEYQEVFRNYAKLRNRVRWAKRPSIVDYSDSAHCFTTAMLAYFIGIESGYTSTVCTQAFFWGILHDYPEIWTGDMPQPVKDSMEGLREAMGAFEDKVLEENVYSNFSSHAEQATRNIYGLEADFEFPKILKLADTLSAFIECWCQLDAGSCHSYFKNVIRRNFHLRKKLPKNFRKLMWWLYIKHH